MRPAWLEIDLDAIAHNYELITGQVGAQVGIVGVVKANAYGHGAVPVARLLSGLGTRFLAVALVQEAVELREAGLTDPILVMGAGDAGEAALFVECGVCATVTDISFARALSEAAVSTGRPGLCHIKIDSGMGRQGVRADHIAAFGSQIAALPGLDVQGIFSHFASSAHDVAFTDRQVAVFSQAVTDLESALGRRVPLRHLANSGGVMAHPPAWLDAVRPGALIYGIPGPDDLEFLPGSRQAMALKARIVGVKPIRCGESVGYSRTFIADRDTTVAILPVGYADGYTRALSGRAEVLLRGVRCPVAGRVSMDCTMVDCRALGDVQVGEEAVLLGRQGEECITVAELARRADTIVQEIVSRMSARLPRVYTGGCREALNDVTCG